MGALRWHGGDLAMMVLASSGRNGRVTAGTTTAIELCSAGQLQSVPDFTSILQTAAPSLTTQSRCSPFLDAPSKLQPTREMLSQASRVNVHCDRLRNGALRAPCGF